MLPPQLLVARSGQSTLSGFTLQFVLPLELTVTRRTGEHMDDAKFFTVKLPGKQDHFLFFNLTTCLLSNFPFGFILT